jgi:hypothetical protein
VNVLEEILYPLVTEAHGSMESSRNITKKPDAVLFGTEGFNSLDLVSFIIMTEEKVEDATGVKLTLASEKAMSRRNSPFRNLQAFADFIQESLTEAGYRG